MMVFLWTNNPIITDGVVFKLVFGFNGHCPFFGLRLTKSLSMAFSIDGPPVITGERRPEDEEHNDDDKEQSVEFIVKV